MVGREELGPIGELAVALVHYFAARSL
jgi:hypothetical protein